MACNSVNSSLEIITVVIMGILIVAALLKRRQTRLYRLFILTAALHIVNTLSDLAAWRFAGQDNFFAHLMTDCGNFLTYLFGPLAYTAFMVVAYLSLTGNAPLRTGTAKVLAGGVFAFGAANVAMPFINLPTAIIYHINATNNFSWGPYSGLPDNLVLAQLVLLSLLVLYQKRDAFRDTMLYLGIPIAALVIENFHNVLMLVYPSIAIALLIIYINEQHKREQELLQNELELTESRTQILSGQITSHFIFNSLQAVRELVAEDPKQAREAIDNFSEYLRGNLSAASPVKLVPLSQEIEHVQAYLALEQIDPASTFRVEWDLQAPDFPLPSLCVQPLVENAVRYGASAVEKGLVEIASREVDGGFCVSVHDNGPGFEGGKAADGEGAEDGRCLGLALDNVRTRLELQCGGSLKIESDADGTTASIFIPKKES